MKPKKLGNGKITALYERLSRDDDLTGDSIHTRIAGNEDG